jgi:hypothetical protein
MIAALDDASSSNIMTPLAKLAASLRVKDYGLFG